MQTTIMSFGYKHGLPLDTDLVIDCRFLPNPHWVDELRPLTGLDEPVRDYVLGQAVTGAVPRRARRRCSSCCCRPTSTEGKSYLTVAFGCTGGQHRSVVIAEEIAAPPAGAGLRPQGHPPRHRPLSDRAADSAAAPATGSWPARRDRIGAVRSAREPATSGGSTT